jgi:hypothetical protein
MKRNYSAKADQTAIATDINDLPINKKVIRNAIETSSKKCAKKSSKKELKRAGKSRFWYDLAERAELCC